MAAVTSWPCSRGDPYAVEVSSFPAQAARVRNVDLPLRRRLLALRECVLHFAPYGFRATWHHLILWAGVPVSLEEDPGSLLRAIDELEDARRLWLKEVQAFTLRRRQEKASGRRRPGRDETWYAWSQWLAFCPDPEVHPTEPLATVVARLITAYRSGAVPADRCPVCGKIGCRRTVRIAEPAPGTRQGIRGTRRAVAPGHPTAPACRGR